MRSPVRLWRELGPAGFSAFQILAGAPVLAALIHPLFLITLGIKLATGDGFFGEGPVAILRDAWTLAVLFAGYLGSAMLAFAGMRRRGQRFRLGILPGIPLYWLMLSAAAWQALVQYFLRPFHWDKTEHGLARTGRAETRRRP